MMPQVDLLPRRKPMRLRDLDARQWLLLAEAAFTLAAASAVIAILPFRNVVALASRSGLKRRSDDEDAAAVSDARWAVEAIAWRVPWRTVCFQKGLALHLMLRRRGIASILHYGVGKEADGTLAAHVWIDVDGRTVQGGEVADRFHRLASYPKRD